MRGIALKKRLDLQKRSGPLTRHYGIDAALGGFGDAVEVHGFEGLGGVGYGLEVVYDAGREIGSLLHGSGFPAAAVCQMVASHFGRQPAPHPVGLVGQKGYFDEVCLVVEGANPYSQGVFVGSFVMNKHDWCVSGSQSGE